MDARSGTGIGRDRGDKCHGLGRREVFRPGGFCGGWLYVGPPKRVREDIGDVPRSPVFLLDYKQETGGIVPFPDPMMNAMSEDFFFCALAKACGFRIVVDTSIRCGHMTTSEFCEKSMEMQKIEILDQTEVKHI